MKKIIENLKQKPEHVRRQVLLACSLAITGIIFGSWLFLFKSEFSKPEKKKPDLANDLKPLSMIKDDFLKTFQTVSSGVGNLKDEIKTTVSETQADATAGTGTDMGADAVPAPDTNIETNN